MTLNAVDEAFLNALHDQLPAAVFKPASDAYTHEPRGMFTGRMAQLLAPTDTDQVATILRAANAARVAVVPYGGGTGLVGGQVRADAPAPLVLSLERMNRLRAVSAADNVMVAEAGVILQNAQAAAQEADRLFALSLASQGSCQIGGNLSTNAGGVNVLRYGNARAQCLGLEAVLPDGRIWHGLKHLHKDNTGYDLRDLLIGAEGTLGVITAAVLRLHPRPAHTGAALIVVPDPTAALALLRLSDRHLGEAVSAFELIHGTGLRFLSETMPDIRQPFATPPDWSVLIDVGMIGTGNPADALGDLFADAHEQGLALDGLVAQNEAQRQAFWAVRETIPQANKRIGPVSSHDISLPLGSAAEFIRKGGEMIAAMGDLRINSFGHLGDGNLHYNVFPAKGRHKSDYPGMAAKVRRAVHDLVAEFGGSFSAEHGIGRMKTGELARYGDPAKLAAMRAIKTALDPNGIMNPGAVLP